ncbi:MAG: nucleotidyl transferase AbiEii/AbiGii toxin family protein [Candidatus Asgardarchaeia archaeon]
MKIVKITKRELTDVWKIPFTFEEKIATRQYLESFSKEIGIATRYLEHMLWQLDTLYILSAHSSEFVWKGGTCIQSFVPPDYQRHSVDIDLNSSLTRKNILAMFKKLNNELITKGKYVALNDDVKLGTFVYHSEDRVTGSLNFFRLVPVKHGGESIYKSQIKVIGAIPIRVQINYKIAKELGFIALKVVQKTPQLAPYHLLKKQFVYPHESVEDLIADKIVTMSEIPVFHRGRLRIKDTYDIIVMLNSQQKINKSVVSRKLELYSDAWKTSKDILLDVVKNSLIQISKMGIEVLGLKGSVGVTGFSSIIMNWQKRIGDVLSFLEGL